MGQMREKLLRGGRSRHLKKWKAAMNVLPSSPPISKPRRKAATKRLRRSPAPELPPSEPGARTAVFRNVAWGNESVMSGSWQLPLSREGLACLSTAVVRDTKSHFST